MHTAGVMTGSVHVYGDKGYASDERKRAAEKAGVKWAERRRRSRGAS